MAVALGATCPVFPGGFIFLALYPGEEVISLSHKRDLSHFNLNSSCNPTCILRKKAATQCLLSTSVGSTGS